MSSDSSCYRFTGLFILRLMGVGLAVTGLVFLALAAVVGLVGLPSALLLAGLVPLVALLVGVLVLRRADVVRFGGTGYRVRFVRGGGVRQAGWKDVEDVVTAQVGGEPCVVLRLRDGGSTTIPVGLLAGAPDALVLDLQRHLNRGHGYRPLPGRGA